MKHVTILRRWGNPVIEIEVTGEDISLRIGLDDFIKALTDEVAEPIVRQAVMAAGSPALLFTSAQLERRLVEAIEGAEAHAIFVAATQRIVEAVKAETARLV